MADFDGYLNWRWAEELCPGLFQHLDPALIHGAIEIARTIGNGAVKVRPTRAWLDARGFTAVIRPDYIQPDLDNALTPYLRRKGVERRIAYADYCQFRPIDFVEFPLTDEAIGHVNTIMFLHDTLVFDLAQTFALYESADDYHLVAGPEADLEEMIGCSFEDAAREQQDELAKFEHLRKHIPALLRDLGGPQAKLMGFA